MIFVEPHFIYNDTDGPWATLSEAPPISTAKPRKYSTSPPLHENSQ